MSKVGKREWDPECLHLGLVSQPFETVEKGLREIGVADGW